MKGKVPTKKPFGRESPPRGYPKNKTDYADPNNWRYPLHTPWHAKAAKRYFAELSNRSKYSQEECEYIDWRIEEALKRFQIGKAKIELSDVSINALTVNDMLKLLMGNTRFQRIQEIDDSLVTLKDNQPNLIDAKIKDYNVQIRPRDCSISHDCQDWKKNLDAKTVCKHVAKLFKMLDEDKAKEILRSMLSYRGQWKFIAS